MRSVNRAEWRELRNESKKMKKIKVREKRNPEAALELDQEMKTIIGIGWLIAGSALGQAGALVEREWMVDGVRREALWVEPKVKTADRVPVVFVFHGHGGTMRNIASAFQIETLWPEALVIYMQGLNTPGRLSDPQGLRSGWQHGAKDQGGRDLKFFDQVLATAKAEQEVDERRIYSTGHSNGGGFTYLLWAERGEVLAAVAPSAASGGRHRQRLLPKPFLLISGEADELVKFEWQMATVEMVRRLNGCAEGEGKAWALDERCTVYESEGGTPVVTAIHAGGHGFPKRAPAVIVNFFKQHVQVPKERTEATGER
jgi:polyhydroxybutyrate depolymerase